VRDTELGILRRVDVREIWNNEAKDFSPWLAASLPRLGEELDMDLELVGREMPVHRETSRAGGGPAMETMGLPSGSESLTRDILSP
jgi:hypothetical protein